MYDGIQKIDKVIDYIEENILEDIDCEALAAEMSLSPYEFRRIFSFIVGCPISQYIRSRRLSLAACELLNDKPDNMCVISAKYGYSTQSAFIKAFGAFHGVSPTAYLKGKTDLKIFTRTTYNTIISGGENINFSIQTHKPFYISGFAKTMDTTNNGENNLPLLNLGEIGLKSCEGNYYTAYKNQDNKLWYLVGEKSATKIEWKDNLLIPEAKYACFKLSNTEANSVNQAYNKIIHKILPSARLTADRSLPFICIYTKEKSKSVYETEIRIPIL